MGVVQAHTAPRRVKGRVVNPSKPRLLVLGATGFIGRNAVEYFARSNRYEVHATQHVHAPYTEPGVLWRLRVDLRDPQAVHGLFTDVEPDIVIQCAATTSGARDIVLNPALHVTDNAVINSYLFRAAVVHRVRHVIYPSCSVMYPSGYATPVEERDFDANRPLIRQYYGVGHTKLYLEKMAEFYAGISQTKFTCIRQSNIYGPHDKFDAERSHVFGATVAKVMGAPVGSAVTVWGDGSEERDFLHVDDLCGLYEAAMERQQDSFGLYNGGSGEAVSVGALVHKVVVASGKALSVTYDETRPTIPSSVCISKAKAKDELGWEPKVDLERGIRDTLDWYGRCYP